MAGLTYLGHAFGISDEEVVRRWVENPYWQFFCGEEYFRHDFPIDPSSLSRWRKRIGEKGSELILKITLAVGLRSGAVRESSLERITVDTTVQPKAVAFPTDSRLCNRSRERLVKLAAKNGVDLRQSYSRLGAQALLKAGRYLHARQGKRARRVSIAATNRDNFVVGMFVEHGNPYDGHTLSKALEQVERITCETIERGFVDRGYRGHGIAKPEIFISGRRRGMTPQLKKELKRRSAIEPVIGHMKADGKLGRNHLLGELGDKINALL